MRSWPEFRRHAAKVGLMRCLASVTTLPTERLPARLFRADADAWPAAVAMLAACACETCWRFPAPVTVELAHAERAHAEICGRD